MRLCVVALTGVIVQSVSIKPFTVFILWRIPVFRIRDILIRIPDPQVRTLDYESGSCSVLQFSGFLNNGTKRKRKNMGLSIQVK